MKIAQNDFAKKFLVFFLMIMMVIGNVRPVSAHNAYFLQVLVDENTMSYYGAVVSDKANAFSSEKKHIEPTLGDFSDIKNFSLSGSVGRFEIIKDIDTEAEYSGQYDKFEQKNNGKDEMVFTFPPVERKRPAKNNATSRDVEQAYEIRDTLIPNLNEVLIIMNDGERFESIEKLMSASESISGSSSSYNGWSITYPDNENIRIAKDGKVFDFVYKMSKGYTSQNMINGNKSPVYNADYDYSGDVDDLTMTDLIIQANYTALVKGYLAEDAGEFIQRSTIEVKLSEFFTNLLYDAKNFLGLFSVNELVYNGGVRTDSRYFMGAMPNEWFNISVFFYLIVFALSWALLGASFIKLILMKNLSTVNPSMRISLMSGIKDFMFTGFFLSTNLILVYGLLKVNQLIVGIFGEMMPSDFNLMGPMNSSSASFAGVLLSLYYLFITVYFNIVYIYRALSLSVLIATGPFYAVRLSFGGQNKQAFETWWREVIGNIFIQSFHAFFLAIFLSFQMSSRGIETAVIAFALIPLASKFRSLMLGGGGFSEELGMAPIAATAGIASSAMRKNRNKENANQRIEQSSKDNSSGGNSSSGTSSSPTGSSSIPSIGGGGGGGGTGGVGGSGPPPPPPPTGGFSANSGGAEPFNSHSMDTGGGIGFSSDGGSSHGSSSYGSSSHGSSSYGSSSQATLTGDYSGNPGNSEPFSGGSETGSSTSDTQPLGLSGKKDNSSNVDKEKLKSSGVSMAKGIAYAAVGASAALAYGHDPGMRRTSGQGIRKGNEEYRSGLQGLGDSGLEEGTKSWFDENKHIIYGMDDTI